MNKNSLSPASGRMTLTLINREEALTSVARAVTDPQKRVWIFFFHADGGIGKTRLLQALTGDEARLQQWREESGQEIVVNERLVDLYHYDTHTVEGFIDVIVQALDPGLNYFAEYEDARRKLDVLRADPGEGSTPIETQRHQVRDAFLRDYGRLEADFRVLLALDTLETLVYEQEEQLIALGGLESSDVWSWLVDTFLPQVTNTVLLIAGRPEAKDLVGELASLDNVEFEQKDLKPFTEEDSLAYFDAVAAAARAVGQDLVGRRIEGIPVAMRQVVHYFTDGRPILLALMIDYLAITGEVFPLFQLSPAEAKEETEGRVGQVQAILERELVRSLQETTRETDETLRLLAWAPKGVGAELLAYLRTRQKPSAEELAEAKEALDAVRTLSFVKERPGGDRRLFLHDEMYALFERHVLRHLPPPTRRSIYTVLIAYYDQVVAQARTQAAKLPTDAPPEKRRAVTQALNRALVEEVYYRLRWDTFDGLKTYYRYADEAAMALEQELAQLLQNELIRFLREPQREQLLADLEDQIKQELAIHSVNQRTQQGKPQAAVTRAKNIRERFPTLFASSFADAEMKVYEGWANIYLGEMERAQNLLTEASEALAQAAPDEFDAWRQQISLAYSHTLLGYYHRSLGQFEQAEAQYREALPYWRALKELAVDYANTLNNLGWVLAQVGDFHWAERYVRDALEMREKMGQPTLVAFSENTLGLIKTRQGYPEQAEVFCRRALHTFRAEEEARGIGLAAIALAEALRRKAVQPGVYRPPKSAEFLRQAEDLAQEAAQLFEEVLDEPERRVEAHLELGCIYRDWAPIRAAYQSEDDPTQVKLEEEGVRTLRKAAQQAGEKFLFRQIDALVNLAWHYYYMGRHADAGELLKQEVFPQVDPYLIKDGQPTLENPTHFIWVQLGKAHALLGQIAFDDYRQALLEAGRQPGDKVPDSAKPYLEAATEYWALGLEYDHLFGDDFRDLRAGLDRFYNNIRGLNPDEVNIMEARAAATAASYGLSAKDIHLTDYLKKGGVK